MLIRNASWITRKGISPHTVPVFRRDFCCGGEILEGTLEVTAAGVYDAVLNGMRVGDFILSPGWTEYHKRLQVQRYDITHLLRGENRLEITVANGWYRRTNAEWTHTKNPDEDLCAMAIAALRLRTADGGEQVILTDGEWQAGLSNISLSGIFDGEDVDARIEPHDFEKAETVDYPRDALIPQEGPEIREQEIVYPRRSFRTPKGEWVLDFGQNLTGYMVFEGTFRAGERLIISTAEVLDKDGNFYNANYRFARSRLSYICRDGFQRYKPRFTFFGFRYLRLDEAPGSFTADSIHAVVVHSEMKRTGWLETDDPLLGQLFSNILWSQKGNYLDIPTDCPQRDERYGWTGDGQLFAGMASLQFDVRQFFRKWLADLRAAQREDGWVPEVVPSVVSYKPGCGAWSDAAAIIPWQMYQTYGDEAFLRDQYDSMTAWVDYIPSVSRTPDLWTGCWTYGDWLALDHPEGYVPPSLEESKRGYSSDDLICSAYYANSLDLVIRSGKILGRDTGKYEAQYQRTVKKFREVWSGKLRTQTEKVLAICFHLAEDPQRLADELAQQVLACGTHLKTGLLGTAHLLHVLSDWGHTDLAWSLLLRREYPGWLYSVTRGATTLWEHWDNIRPDGSFWSEDMNSFNHYAYGAVGDWVFRVACGIRAEAPGFMKIRISPQPDPRLHALSGTLDTVRGRIRSAWKYTESGIRYEIDTPAEAEIIVNGKTYHVPKGHYLF